VSSFFLLTSAQLGYIVSFVLDDLHTTESSYLCQWHIWWFDQWLASYRAFVTAITGHAVTSGKWVSG